MLLHKRKILTMLATTAALSGSVTLQAAPVDITSLDMDMTSLDLDLNGAIHSFNTTNPVSIIMGVYQNPIVTMTDADGDTVTIYTAGANPAPSGTADAALGTLNVDFTALLADFTLLAAAPPGGGPGGGGPGNGGGDGGGGPGNGGNTLFTTTLWDNTTIIGANAYNGLDNTFMLGWTTDVNVNGARGSLRACAGGRANCDTTTALEGKVNVVPIPAAVWLFGSGLLGLIAVTRRNRQQAA